MEENMQTAKIESHELFSEIDSGKSIERPKPTRKKTKGKTFKRSFVAFFVALYTFLCLFVLFVSCNSFYGHLTYRQPTVFGYSIFEIDSTSLESLGFKKGELVITKKVAKPEDIKKGDFITFYVHSDFGPIIDGDDRSKAIVVFHEIIDIDSEGNFITRGLPSGANDPHAIPFESISGVYNEPNTFVEYAIKSFLVENRVLYWLAAILIILLIIIVVSLISSNASSKIRREVIQGKRSLLDKKCFDFNVFNSFSGDEKQSLVENAPFGMKLLYKYLLTGSTALGLNEEIDACLKKNCDLADVLCLTYGGEINANFTSDEYIMTMQGRKEKVGSFSQLTRYRSKSRARVSYALANLLGCFAFIVSYVLLLVLASAFTIVSLYEFILVLAIPTIIVLYIILKLLGRLRIQSKIQKYLLRCNELPERYHFIVTPNRYSAEEIESNDAEIRRRLSQRDYSFIDSESEVAETKRQMTFIKPNAPTQPLKLIADDPIPTAVNETPASVQEVNNTDENDMQAQEVNNTTGNEVQIQEAAETTVVTHETIQPLVKNETILIDETDDSVSQSKAPLSVSDVEPIREIAATSQKTDEDANNFNDVELGSKYNPFTPTKPRWNGTLHAKSIPTKMD